MSTDWIKMRVDLRTHPKVVRMASALKADKLRVIGGLFSVWSIFDAHSTDGVLEGYTFESIDGELHWRGFAQAMAGIEWLIYDPQQGDGLLAPRFEEHNGQSAKRRAMGTERKRLEREAEKLAADAAKAATKAGQVSASKADKSVTREEKRREEKEIPPTPLKGEGRFPEFWSSWPNTERKQDRKKCLEKWQRKGWDAEADAILAHVASSKASKKWLDGYEPAPLTYLNGERWRDGVTVAEPGDIFAGAK